MAMPLGDSYDKTNCSYQKIIDEQYGGDINKFFAANSTFFEEYNREKCHWNELCQAATIYPELEAEGRQVILDLLGYMPPDSVIFLHEPALRAVIHQERCGLIPFEKYYDLIDETIKLIRNDDLRPHNLPKYYQQDFASYHRQWNPYGQRAKDRITELLGYEPKLEHSLMAENMLRSFYAASDVLQTKGLTEFDCLAVTVIKFREVLTAEGLQAALASELWGIELKYSIENKIINI